MLSLLGAESAAQSDAERERIWRETQVDQLQMLEQLGVQKLRPGADPNAEESSGRMPNYDEAKANVYPDWPTLLVMQDGREINSQTGWWLMRRPELATLFENEVVGRIPETVPALEWIEVDRSENGLVADRPVAAIKLEGQVDNSLAPDIEVTIDMTVVTPKDVEGPIPFLVMYAWLEYDLPREGVEVEDPFARPGGAAPSHETLIKNGWGFAYLYPRSIQPDNGAGLREGIIGLTNRGEFRQLTDWGALRAWAWGGSRALDYLETRPEIDATKIGIEGVSRYGKAALVAMAYEPRFAFGLIGSSGAGGAAPYRRDFGEKLENLTGGGAYHWFCGNFMKYGAAESRIGDLDADDLPIEAHHLIALSAPRPLFISYGIPEMGDALWLDQQGSYMATVAAGEAYRLLGAKALEDRSFRDAILPPVNYGLLEGELAWRQHDGGHEDRTNMQHFVDWAEAQFAKAESAE